MIILTKLNGIKFGLNDEYIETIHENPDTTIHLTNGVFYIVKESMQEVIDLIIVFRQTYSNEVFYGKDVTKPRHLAGSSIITELNDTQE